MRIRELKVIIDTVLKSLGSEKTVIGITLVNDKTIHELNRKYRKKDRPTDVLSFALREGEDLNDISSDFIGDVVISVETALRQAREMDHSFEKELTILLIHGVLHLFGYDHIKKRDFDIMRKKEKEIFELINDLQMKLKFTKSSNSRLNAQ